MQMSPLLTDSKDDANRAVERFSAETIFQPFHFYIVQ